MPNFGGSAVLSFCSSSAILIILFDVFLFSAQLANSSTLDDESFVGPLREYAYEPISDKMLRSLLGYGPSKKENIRPIRIVIAARPPKEIRMESEKRDESANDQRIVMEKRKNAELVNHILKNFASLNRLGDAGRK